MHRPTAIVIAALASLVLLGRARSDPRRLESAVALYEAGKLSSALLAFEEALESGGHTSDELATIYLHLGILRAGSRDVSGAEDAFVALCTIAAAAEAPPGSSPVVTEPFEHARARCRAAGALEARIEGPETVMQGDAIAIVVGVVGDAAAIVRRASVSIARGGSNRAELGAGSRATLVLSKDVTARPGSLTLRIDLLDAYGSVVRTFDRAIAVEAPAETAGTSTDTLRALGAPASPPTTDGEGSLLGNPWFWAATGVAAALGAIVLLVAMQGSGKARVGQIEVSDR